MPNPDIQSASRRAWFTAALLGAGVLVNYFDRVNLSVAQGALRQQWGIGDIGFGYLSSAYSWTYALLQMPMGALLDALGVRAIGTVAAFLWSVASFAAAFSPGLRSFFSARLLLGIAEAPTFPANAKAIAQWFPLSRRGLPTAIFDSGAKLGTALGVPMLGFLLVRYGWRWSFCFTGVLSFAYFVAFAFFYRERKEDPGPELASSRVSYPVSAAAERGPDSGRPGSDQEDKIGWAVLLTNRKVLGLTLGFAGYGYSFYLFLSWLPSYLGKTMHMDVVHSAVATSVPWGFATASDLIVGGWLVDHLIARGYPATTVRKIIVSVGLAMGLGVLGALHTTNSHAALAWISFALIGLAASAPVAWQIPALIAPEAAVGRVAGIMNFATNVMAIVAPVVTGYLVAATHDFAWAFSAAAAVVAAGIVGYTIVLGRIELRPFT